MWLNTKDKVEFYRHLGYVDSSAVTPKSDVTELVNRSNEGLFAPKDVCPLIPIDNLFCRI